jgi:hypothetical protein
MLSGGHLPLQLLCCSRRREELAVKLVVLIPEKWGSKAVKRRDKQDGTFEVFRAEMDWHQ